MSMEPAEYRCWAEHAEDLTRQVMAVLASGKGRRYGFEDSEHDEPQDLVVECSEGHTNVFQV